LLDEFTTLPFTLELKVMELESKPGQALILVRTWLTVVVPPIGSGLGTTNDRSGVLLTPVADPKNDVTLIGLFPVLMSW
jgi:hypothetical protein